MCIFFSGVLGDRKSNLYNMMAFSRYHNQETCALKYLTHLYGYIIESLDHTCFCKLVSKCVLHGLNK